MISKYKRLSNVGAAVCLTSILVGIAVVTMGDADPSQAKSALSGLFMGLGGLALIFALWFLIKAKGRSAWWMLAVIFNIVGLVVILMLGAVAPMVTQHPH